MWFKILCVLLALILAMMWAVAMWSPQRRRAIHQTFVLLAKIVLFVAICGAARHVAKNPLFKDFTFHESVLPNSEQPETADLGFGVMKDDVELLNKINTGLQNIKQSGELDAIIKKWI